MSLRSFMRRPHNSCPTLKTSKEPSILHWEDQEIRCWQNRWPGHAYSQPPIPAPAPNSRHESVKPGATSILSMLNKATEAQNRFTFCWIASWSSEGAVSRVVQLFVHKWGRLCKGGKVAASWGQNPSFSQAEVPLLLTHLLNVPSWGGLGH